MAGGRPEKYTDELANSILETISTSNKGIVAICKENNISVFTFYKWIDEKPEFAKLYARAKELQSEFLVEEILTLSDNERLTTDEITNSEGTYTVTKDNYNRTRLQVDSRKWLASKLYPKKFGEKIDLTTQGEKINNYDDFIKQIKDA